MWQKCPICKRTGIDKDTNNKCDVCGGMKIINVKTGMPPKLSDIKDFNEDEGLSYLRKENPLLKGALIKHYWTDDEIKIYIHKDVYNLSNRKPYVAPEKDIMEGLENIKEYWLDGIIREPKIKHEK